MRSRRIRDILILSRRL